MFKRLYVACIISAFVLSFVSPALCADKQAIAGAGPSTKVVELFVKEFSKQPIANNYSFTVPPKSTKHAGGIKHSDYYLFGRTGRPLNDKEKALNKEEIFLARLPITFVVGSKARVNKLTIAQVEDIFTGKITNWKAVGGADKEIFTIGREPSEALFSILKKNNPAFKKASFSRILEKDHYVVKFLLMDKGDHAIAFGAKPNFEAKGINVIDVDGFSVGVSVGLVYDKKNTNHELVKAAKAFAASDEWANAVKGMGLLPPQ